MELQNVPSNFLGLLKSTIFGSTFEFSAYSKTI